MAAKACETTQAKISKIFSDKDISTESNQMKNVAVDLPGFCASETNTATNSKSREQVMKEREMKKLAKQALKSKSCQPVTVAQTVCATANLSTPPLQAPTTDKTRDQIKIEREAKKQAKQAAKASNITGMPAKAAETATLESAVTHPKITTEKKQPALTKAERRAVQEAQRAAKGQVQTLKSTNTKQVVDNKPLQKTVALVKNTTVTISNKETVIKKPSAKLLKINSDCKVRLFNHLETARTDCGLFVNNTQIHPSIARLGEQYAKRTIVGSNARCIAFLNALKMVIQDFETPPQKEFARSLELFVKSCVEHLQNCRPLAVSVSNAYKHIKHVLTQLPNDASESDLKENLCHFIDTYLENQIDKAAQAINSSMQEKISNGDVILTFGCSSLIEYICVQAQARHVNFRVVIVDSRPFCEGQELLRRLTAKEIPCTYLLINAVGFVMPEVTKVMLGAHALLSNGYVMARTGTAQVALIARSFNVPVLVCCETHKFSERFQTDAIVYNELGNPDDLILSDKCCLTNWQDKHKMSPLNLMYDITPPELVTAVVTEVSILPCTSVPVILRIKPTEIGYYS